MRLGLATQENEYTEIQCFFQLIISYAEAEVFNEDNEQLESKITGRFLLSTHTKYSLD